MDRERERRRGEGRVKVRGEGEWGRVRKRNGFFHTAGGSMYIPLDETRDGQDSRRHGSQPIEPCQSFRSSVSPVPPFSHIIIACLVGWRVMTSISQVGTA